MFEIEYFMELLLSKVSVYNSGMTLILWIEPCIATYMEKKLKLVVRSLSIYVYAFNYF